MCVCVYHVHIHNGLFIPPQEKGNLAICDNMDRPWGHYACEVSQRRKNIVKYHLYMEIKPHLQK